jgi:hypothetical protein
MPAAALLKKKNAEAMYRFYPANIIRSLLLHCTPNDEKEGLEAQALGSAAEGTAWILWRARGR